MDCEPRPRAAMPAARPDGLSCPPLPQASLHRIAQEALLRVARLPCIRPAPLDMADPADVAALCAALLESDGAVACRVIDTHLAAGRDKNAIALALMPEAARRLGQMWEGDEVSFVQVAKAVGRLQRLLRVLRAEAGSRRSDPLRRALFATLPEETHTFGVILAADAFRQNGWEIELSLGETTERFLACLAEDVPPVLGLSAGSRASALAVMRLVPAIRAAAPGTRVMLGGPCLAACADLVRQIPVDGRAGDIATALAEADRLVGAA